MSLSVKLITLFAMYSRDLAVSVNSCFTPHKVPWKIPSFILSSITVIEKTLTHFTFYVMQIACISQGHIQIVLSAIIFYGNISSLFK